MALLKMFGFLQPKKTKRVSARIKKKNKIKKPKKIKKKGIRLRKKLCRNTGSQKTVAKKTKLVGIITHRFSKIKVAVIKVKNKIQIGDTVLIKGHTSNFSQRISSIQINHEQVKCATSGQEIGLRVKKRVRINDKVFKVS